MKEIEVTVKDDGVNRDDTTVAVSLKNPTGAVLGETAMHTYTILDSSPEPAVTFTTASQQVKESAGTATIGVELSAISGRDVTVPLLVSGTAKTPGNFTMTSGPVVIKAGTKSATVPVQVAANGVNEDDKTVVVSMGVPTHGVQGKTTTSTVTIVDTDPVPAVSFASASSSGEEKSGPARLEVKLSAASGKPVTVEYGVKGGTAVLGKDYALPAGVLSFEPGETSKTLVVDIKDHGIYDDDKTLEITLKNPKNAVLGKTTIHTHTLSKTNSAPAAVSSTAEGRQMKETSTLVTITVEPAADPGKDAIVPAVTFAGASSSGEEKSGPARLEVKLSAASGKPVWVEYGVKGGTAVLGKDYALPAGVLSFEPGETSKTLVVDIKDHGIYDDDKTLEIALKNPKNAVLGGSPVHTLTIVHTAPLPAVAFLHAGSRGTEKSGSARLEVQLSSASGKPVRVEYEVTGGTAEAGKQYVLKGTSLTFAPGETVKEIEVTVKDDGVNRDDTTVAVSLKNPTGAVLGETAMHTYTILDSSPEPAVTFTTASQQVKESAGTAAIGVELSAISGRDVTVPLLVSGTAKTPENYTMTPGPVVIKAGTKSATVPVQVAANGVNEDDKTVVVSMGVPTHGVQGKTTTSTVTIVDTDPVPAVSFASASSSGEEKSGPARLEVKLSAASGKPVWVEYGVKGGTAVLGKDYALPAGVLSFEPGETSKTLVVDIKDHGIYDDDKTLEIALKNPKNAVLGGSPVHTLTIVHTAPLPAVAFLHAGSRGTEKSGSARLEVQLSAPSGKPVRVEYEVTGGTAEAGKQYVLKGTSLTFAPGETVKEIEVTVKDDGVNRDDTTVAVSLKNPTGAVLGETAMHTYTILDSSPEPAVTFTTASQQVKESAGTAAIGVELSAISGRDVTVPLLVSGTAKTPSNYTMTPGPVVIKAGTKSATVPVQVAANGVNEDDKTVVVSMGVPTHGVQGKTTTSTVTIVDTDPVPAVSFASASSSGEEKSGPARLEVKLSAASGKPVWVEYGVKGGTAVLGKDYALPAGVLSFEPGETSKTLVVDIKDHGIYDDDKTLEITLKNPKNAVLGSTAVHTRTIIVSGESEQTTGVSRPVQQAKATTGAATKNATMPLMMLAMADIPGNSTIMPVLIAAKTDERRVGIPKPTVAFLYAISRGYERVSTVRIPVALNAVSGKPVTVEYAVRGGTAVRGMNYTLKDGGLTFKPGETVKTIEVSIKDNGVNEPDRTVELSLMNPKNAVLGNTAVHTYTIMDNDPEPAVTFTVAGQQVKESARSVSIGVELSTVSGWDVAVPFLVTGTARTPGNYSIVPSPLVIKEGQRSASITVQVADNGLNEDDKTVAVSMGVPTHAVQGKVVASTVTIVNIDPEPAVTFTMAGQQVKENAGKATIGVELSAVSGRDVIVPLMVSGTAKTPENFAMPSGPVVIKAGTKSATIPVQVVANGVSEDDKTVVVSMGVPIHAVQGKTTANTVTIVNTDPEPTVSFASASSSGEEKSGPAHLEVKLSAASGRPVTVEYAASGGTAIQGKDYALQGGPLTFAPGETAKEILVDIKNHNIYSESKTKTIEVALKNASGAVLGSSAVFAYTIVNNHMKPTVVIRTANQRIRKSAGRLNITVQLSEVSGKDVTVPFTVSGTAIQGKDFAITPSPVVIRAGMRSMEIVITMKDNIPVEADKTIEVRLSNPDNAFLGLTGVYRIVIVKDAIPTIAVVPFFTTSTKKNAGDIMALQFVKELKKQEDFVVIEPGVVRQQFLDMRVIMSEGVSSADIDLITSKIDADLILAGQVMDYQDDIALYGKPKVAFSVMLIDRSSKKIIWASRSSNKGDDAVTLFDWGSVNSANEMVSEMVRVLTKRVVTW